MTEMISVTIAPSTHNYYRSSKPPNISNSIINIVVKLWEVVTEETSRQRPSKVYIMPSTSFAALLSFFTLSSAQSTNPATCNPFFWPPSLVCLLVATTNFLNGESTKPLCQLFPGRQPSMQQCNNVAYCSNLCQETYWPLHKLLCRSFTEF